MGLPNTNFLSFIGRELKNNPFIAFILILLLTVGALARTIFWQEQRYDILQEKLLKSEAEKGRLTRELMLEQIKISTRVEEIARELREKYDKPIPKSKARK